MANGSEIVRPIGTFASVFLAGDGDTDRDDFQQVPSTDRGNENYRDRGLRGNYAPRHDNFPDPDGLVRFTGYGADEGDLRRGFVAPANMEDPAYDLINYKGRSSMPKVSDEDFENTSTMPSDYEFRGRNRTSRGFLRRPHIPTERG